MPQTPTSSLSWEDFLTERDKAYLRSTEWTKTEPFGLGDRAAVIVIDDYYEATGTDRVPILEAIRTWPKSCGQDAWDAIDQTVRLLAAARAAGAPVVYVKRLAGFRTPVVPAVRGWQTGRTAEETAFADRIVEEIAPTQDDLVIEKTSPSCFNGTPLAAWLNARRIDTLLMCGEATSGCVRASVVDAASLRYRVGVVKECCFDRLQANHWINLFDMNQKYADVMDLDAVCDYLKSAPW